MSKSHFMGGVLVAALAIAGGPDIHARGGSTDVLVQWNQLLQTTLPPTAALLGPRYYSMMHIAMFDAVNAIEREYEPYRTRVRHASGSPEAAAAQAAHDILSSLIPASKPAYDAALAAQLGSRRSGFEARGALVGAIVAKEILKWRENDGWLAPQPPYVEPALPGRWQPTAPNFPTAAFTHVQNAAPMALLTPTQFLPLPPPTLISEQYAADLNEVKAIGKSDSGTRSLEQTHIARLWAGVAASGAPGTATNLFAIWNNITRDVVVDRGLDLVDAARVFVLVNVSIHDGLHTTQTSKFVYGLWRPVTAIQNAGLDLNAATDPDPGWLPLITTPPYPAYAGNMACVGASAATALRLAFGTNDIPVSATWQQSVGGSVTHDFAGFWQAAQEQAESRIYGGIHYRFDQEAGQAVGRSVAGFVFANYVRPRGRWED